MDRKKRSKKVWETIISRELIPKKGQILEINPPKSLVIKDVLIFLEMLSIDLTILKGRKV